MFVCFVSVCLSVLHISKTARPNFANCCALHVDNGPYGALCVFPSDKSANYCTDSNQTLLNNKDLQLNTDRGLRTRGEIFYLQFPG